MRDALGAPASLRPRRYGVPIAIVQYYLYAERFPVQVMPTESLAPPPPLGQGWRKGGLNDPSIMESDHELTWNPVAPKFSGNFDFPPKNPGVQTFARNFFGFFNFQTGKNLAGKISIQIFLRFPTFDRNFFWFLKFRGKKKYGIPDPGAGTASQDLRRRSELVVQLTPIFPTFAPTFFGIFNFQPEFFWDFQISSRKKSGKKNFAAKKSGHSNFRAGNF